MNQQCKVCGEPAAGFHFGAFTCEGCKSFFGRTYNNLGSITECKNNGECVINKKNRTACKACRLRKCLLVGMSKSGSRYGRRSNWFKIHCLLQEQSQNGGTNGLTSGLTNGLATNLFGSPPTFFPASLLSPSSLLSPDTLFRPTPHPHSPQTLPPPPHHLKHHKHDPPNTHSDSNDSSLDSSPTLHSASAHNTPSPFSDSSPAPAPTPVSHRPNPPYAKLSPFAPLAVSPSAMFFPPSQPSPTRLLFPPVVAKPGVTPINPHHLLGAWPPAGAPNGGSLMLCSPALGGVAVEQEHPMDLSIKASSVAYNSPPTPVSNQDSDNLKGDSDGEDEDLTIDVEMCKESVLKNNPLDLTAKRVEVPQSG